MGDVEPDAAVLRAPALGDLRVRGERDPVAGGQFHPLGIVALHEPLAEGVAEDAALTAGGFGDERARCVLGFEDARGVELDEFGVAEPAAGFDGEAEGIARVLIAA